MTRHHYGISALVPQTSLRVETSVGIAKCRLFSTLLCPISQESLSQMRFTHLCFSVPSASYHWSQVLIRSVTVVCVYYLEQSERFGFAEETRL